MEALKLEPVAKGKERAQIAQANKEKEVEIKTKATQEKIRRSMEVNKENREAQIQALQGRLRDHVSYGVKWRCLYNRCMVLELSS